MNFSPRIAQGQSQGIQTAERHVEHTVTNRKMSVKVRLLGLFLLLLSCDRPAVHCGKKENTDERRVPACGVLSTSQQITWIDPETGVLHPLAIGMTDGSIYITDIGWLHVRAEE